MTVEDYHNYAIGWVYITVMVGLIMAWASRSTEVASIIWEWGRKTGTNVRHKFPVPAVMFEMLSLMFVLMMPAMVFMLPNVHDWMFVLKSQVFFTSIYLLCRFRTAYLVRWYQTEINRLPRQLELL